MSEPYERLREARLRAGYAGPADAARAFGWNVNTYKSTENGIRAITAKKARTYAPALKTTVSFLLTGKDEGTSDLGIEERLVLAMFRVMSDRDKRAVLALCESLTKPQIATQQRA
jgi:transcriptional regulator with XRE-family HTH domain